jgi:hypothetical protein
MLDFENSISYFAKSKPDKNQEMLKGGKIRCPVQEELSMTG